MVNRPKICTICNWQESNIITPGESYKSRGAERRRHENIECGTWAQLIEELQRMYNINPETTEESLRTLIRITDQYYDDDSTAMVTK